MLYIRPYQDLENSVWDASCTIDDNEDLFSAIDDLVDRTDLAGIKEFRAQYRQLSHRENKSVELAYDTAVRATSERAVRDNGSPPPAQLEEFNRAFKYVCAMIVFREDPEYVTDEGIVAHLLDRECPNGHRFDYKRTSSGYVI